ncbi:MAG TPA: hypothetical protein VM074_08740 [Solimonas sp.]|nr:hypothetical protein [Solimonas sp.]
MKTTSTGLAVLLALVLSGCHRSEPAKAPAQVPAPSSQASARVTDITLGRSLTADKAIADRTDSFRPADTIYVAVRTEGSAASAELQARWTYQDGQLVEEARQTVAPTQGGAMTEFHVSKPDGWPAGNYKVEILLDGQAAQSREFKVT